MKSKKRKLFFYLFSILAILGAWEIVSLVVKSELIVPSPKSVFFAILKFFKNPLFYNALFATFLRVVKAFFIALALGFVLGIAAGVFPSFKIFLSVPLSFVRSTPVVALILIAVFWFGSEGVPSFVGILMTLPLVVTAVESGFSKTDKKLLEMAEIYEFSFFQKFFYLRLPSVFSVLESAVVSAFGMAWKVVVAGEVLTLPKYSLGNNLYSSQVHLETADVFACTIVIVAMSFFCEKILELVFKRKNGGIR